MKYRFRLVAALVSLPLLAAAGERVVSLSPAVTTLVAAVGAEDQLCGRCTACTMSRFSHLPVAGDLGKPFTESVLKCRATLVISDITSPQSNWEILRRCKVNVEMLPSRRMRDLPENLRRLGVLLDVRERASALAGALEKKLDALEKTPVRRRIRAAVIIGVSPIISCGDGSFIADAVKLAGAENIAAGAGREYFILSPEFLVSAEPEVLLLIGVPEKSAREFFRSAAFRGVPAVRENRLIFLDADTWSRLTPPLVDACQTLRRSLDALR